MTCVILQRNYRSHILESIFDKVADMVKGKSDGEQVAIESNYQGRKIGVDILKQMSIHYGTLFILL